MPEIFRLWAESKGFKEFSDAIGDTVYRERVLGRVLDTFSAEVARKAIKNVKQRTRATAQSIRVDRPGILTRAIAVHNIVGLFLERGTREHQITARGRALMLPIRAPSGGGSPFVRTFGPRGTGRLSGATRSGQVGFFKSVHHPGNKPYPFLVPAYHESLPTLELILLKAGAEIGAHMAARGQL